MQLLEINLFTLRQLEEPVRYSQNASKNQRLLPMMILEPKQSVRCASKIRKLEVENLPVIVVIDCEGNNLYETAIKEYCEE